MDDLKFEGLNVVLIWLVGSQNKANCLTFLACEAT